MLIKNSKGKGGGGGGRREKNKKQNKTKTGGAVGRKAVGRTGRICMGV